MNIINILDKENNPMITLDLRTKQIRVIRSNEIFFITMSNDDVEGYKYLFINDKPIFYKCLIEDIVNELGYTYSGYILMNMKTYVIN